MAVRQGSFREIHHRFFGSIAGGYTAVTEKENEKDTYNVKRTIQGVLEAKLLNIPRSGDGTDQKMDFHLWGFPNEIRDDRITCKYSKPDRPEMTIYIRKSLIPGGIVKEVGDIWFIFFRPDDNIPWFGFMKEEDWDYFFGDDSALEQEGSEQDDLSSTDQLDIHEGDTASLDAGVNLIVYGAPGTGKSKYLSDKYNDNVTRVTFHPEYTYYDFVGSYKPVPLYKNNGNNDLQTLDGATFTVGEPIIDYQFVPGPFSTALLNALLSPHEMHTLIIEELNRANTPAVFGDLFQLLDRKEDGSSEYEIKSDPELIKYLRRYNPGLDQLYIPSNLNIVATMNSADQGVFVMDSAFKRRWRFEYMAINLDAAVHANEVVMYNNRNVPWRIFAGEINKNLSRIRGINEDKLIGPYFMRIGEPSRPELISSKLFIYLWDDVVRHHRDQFFLPEIRTFADLVNEYNAGREVFGFPIRELATEIVLVPNTTEQ